MRNDGVAVARDGAACHQADGLTRQNRSVIDEAGPDGGDDVVGLLIMAADGIAVEGRFTVRRIGMGGSHVFCGNAANGSFRGDCFNFFLGGRQGAAETAPCFGNRYDFHNSISFLYWFE